MSGFLQRLVDRSLARTPAVHPRARLGTAWNPQPDSQASSMAPNGEPPRPELDTWPGSGSRPLSVPRRETEESASIPVTTLLPAGTATPGVVNPGADVAGASRPHTPFFGETAATKALVERPVRASSAGPETSRATVLETQASETRSLLAALGLAAPAPLLPLGPGEASEPAHATNRKELPDTRRAVSLTAATQVPDVHIHIGRVELTALSAPTEARRKPARAAATTMSLDDYLRGRNKERAS